MATAVDGSSYGTLSLLPPVVAIVLAIVTKRVTISLLAGIFIGALLVASGNPFSAVATTLETHLWASLSNADHLRVFVFTLLMGAMVGVMQQSGGMAAIVKGIAPLARTRCGGQLTVWLLGLIVFFDDYANSLLLGNTMRPVTDRLRISREKLAYLVDSTAAPVSGLALVSTWVATEIGLVQAGLATTVLAETADAFSIFVATIPYRFYVLWALLFVPLVALLGRDFSAMLRAERNAIAAPEAPNRSPAADDRGMHWANAVIPVAAVVVVTVGLIVLTGQNALAEKDVTDASIMNIFGNGDSYLALVYGSLTGLLLAMLLANLVTRLGWQAIREAAAKGAQQVGGALVILWLAWALSGLTDLKYLGTGQYLGELLQSSLDVRLMPTVVFVLASAVAFSTGTSWGTMGILMPLVVPTVVSMLAANSASVSPENPILVASIGSVLAGAIFGDHCSPISDTTVLSSQASGCNHVAHVRTQLPYALSVGAVSIICGTLPVGFGVPVWFLLPAGVAALVILLLAIGRRVDE
ncbi:MAG: hypothetical protein CMJ64_18895 [Planctomycetaceae bacterium]|nr:hypothetical protein [Planctomycetaceae bacterium]